ncbi:MAG: PH domain-containing protein [Gaiellales bacterium]
MRYADTLLADGEVISRRARQHWLALLIDSSTAIAAFLVGIVALVAIFVVPLQGTARDIASWIALIAIVVGLVVLFIHAWRWWAEDYLVTNRRILKVEGVFSKRSADSALEKINDAVLTQGILGRLLGYGDLDILTAADTAIDRYHMLADAPGFKREMLNEKHALETELSGNRMPSPPMRAETQAAATESPTQAAADSDAVARTLASLADLRDRGAISAEEYDAKKRELLARL